MSYTNMGRNAPLHADKQSIQIKNKLPSLGFLACDEPPTDVPMPLPFIKNSHTRLYLRLPSTLTAGPLSSLGEGLSP